MSWTLESFGSLVQKLISRHENEAGTFEVFSIFAAWLGVHRFSLLDCLGLSAFEFFSLSPPRLCGTLSSTFFTVIFCICIIMSPGQIFKGGTTARPSGQPFFIAKLTWLEVLFLAKCKHFSQLQKLGAINSHRQGTELFLHFGAGAKWLALTTNKRAIKRKEQGLFIFPLTIF